MSVLDSVILPRENSDFPNKIGVEEMINFELQTMPVDQYYWFMELMNSQSRSSTQLRLSNKIRNAVRLEMRRDSPEFKLHFDTLKNFYDNRLKPLENLNTGRGISKNFSVHLHALPTYWAVRLCPSMDIPIVQDYDQLYEYFALYPEQDVHKCWGITFRKRWHRFVAENASITEKNKADLAFGQRDESYNYMISCSTDLQELLRELPSDQENAHSMLKNAMISFSTSVINEILDSLIYAEVTKATESQRTMKFDLKREADRQLHYEKMQMIWEDTVLDRYADLVTSITYLRKQNERENLIASMEELRVPYDPTRAEEFYNMELPSQPRSKDLCNTLPIHWPSQPREHFVSGNDMRELVTTLNVVESELEQLRKLRDLNFNSRRASEILRQRSRSHDMGIAELSMREQYIPEQHKTLNLSASNLRDNTSGNLRQRSSSFTENRPYTSTPRGRSQRVTFQNIHGPSGLSSLDDLSVINSEQGYNPQDSYLTQLLRSDVTRSEIQPEFEEDSDSSSLSFKSFSSEDSSNDSFYSAKFEQSDSDDHITECRGNASSGKNKGPPKMGSGSTFKCTINSMSSKKPFDAKMSKPSSLKKSSHSSGREFRDFSTQTHNEGKSLNETVQDKNMRIKEKLGRINDSYNNSKLAKQFYSLSKESLDSDSEDEWTMQSFKVYQDPPSPMTSNLNLELSSLHGNKSKESFVSKELQDNRVLGTATAKAYEKFFSGNVDPENEIIERCKALKRKEELEDPIFPGSSKLASSFLDKYGLDTQKKEDSLLDDFKKSILNTPTSTPVKEKRDDKVPRKVNFEEQKSPRKALFDKVEPCINPELNDHFTFEEKKEIVDNLKELKTEREAIKRLLDERISAHGKIKEYCKGLISKNSKHWYVKNPSLKLDISRSKTHRKTLESHIAFLHKELERNAKQIKIAKENGERIFIFPDPSTNRKSSGYGSEPSSIETISKPISSTSYSVPKEHYMGPSLTNPNPATGAKDITEAIVKGIQTAFPHGNPVREFEPEPFSGKTTDFPEWLKLYEQLCEADICSKYPEGMQREGILLLKLQSKFQHLGKSPVVARVLSLPLREGNYKFAKETLMKHFYNDDMNIKKIKDDIRRLVIDRRDKINDRDVNFMIDYQTKIEDAVVRLRKHSPMALVISEEDYVKIFKTMPERMQIEWIGLKDELRRRFDIPKEEMGQWYLLMLNFFMSKYVNKCKRLARERGDDLTSVNPAKRPRIFSMSAKSSGSKPKGRKIKSNKRKSANRIKKRVRLRNHPDKVSSNFAELNLDKSNKLRQLGNKISSTFRIDGNPLRSKGKTIAINYAKQRTKPKNKFGWNRSNSMVRQKSNFRQPTQIRKSNSSSNYPNKGNWSFKGNNRSNRPFNRGNRIYPIKPDRYQTHANEVKGMVTKSSFSTNTFKQLNRPTQASLTPRYCQFCKNNKHLTIFCKNDNVPPKVRLQIVREKGLCFNCMEKHPSSIQCKTQLTCRVRGCLRRHHTRLHDALSKGVPAVKQQNPKRTNINMLLSKPNKNSSNSVQLNNFGYKDLAPRKQVSFLPNIGYFGKNRELARTSIRSEPYPRQLNSRQNPLFTNKVKYSWPSLTRESGRFGKSPPDSDNQKPNRYRHNQSRVQNFARSYQEKYFSKNNGPKNEPKKGQYYNRNQLESNRRLIRPSLRRPLTMQ